MLLIFRGKVSVTGNRLILKKFSKFVRNFWKNLHKSWQNKYNDYKWYQRCLSNHMKNNKIYTNYQVLSILYYHLIKLLIFVPICKNDIFKWWSVTLTLPRLYWGFIFLKQLWLLGLKYLLKIRIFSIWELFLIWFTKVLVMPQNSSLIDKECFLENLVKD